MRAMGLLAVVPLMLLLLAIMARDWSGDLQIDLRDRRRSPAPGRSPREARTPH